MAPEAEGPESKRYVKVETGRSRCRFCSSPLTLLQHRAAPIRAAMFYICWKCKRIFEVGKGEVKADD